VSQEKLDPVALSNNTNKYLHMSVFGIKNCHMIFA